MSRQIKLEKVEARGKSFILSIVDVVVATAAAAKLLDVTPPAIVSRRPTF